MNKFRVLIGSLAAVAVLFVAGLMFIPQVDASDCSPNAVVKCGFNSISNLRAKYNSDTTPGTRNIYSYFGLTSSVVNHSTYKEGVVTKSGAVVVDGKTVATNAYSAGRQYISGSRNTKHVVNGTTFYTQPTADSFRSSSLKAIVFFNSNGTFIGATLYDCGNPVGGTPVLPPKPPVYACTSLKAIEVNRNTFNFITDAMAKDGAVIKDYTYDFGDGSSKTTGASTSHTYAKDGAYTVVAKVNVIVNGKTVVAPGTCVVKVMIKTPVPPTPAPVYACNTLSATAVNRNTFKFTTKATASNGAVIKDYVYSFGDSSSKTTGASTSHTYAKPGTYNIVAKVNVVVNGKTVVAPGTCKAQVTVQPEQHSSVTITKTVNDKAYEAVTVNEQFEYKVVVKNTGNTTLKDLKVTDPAPKGITLLSASVGTVKSNVWSYTIPSLAAGKSFSVTMQAKYPAYESGTQVNEACVDTKAITPTHPSLCATASTSTNTPPVVAPPVTPPTPPETPPELPHTGVGTDLTGLLGAGSLTGVALAYVASRRKL